MPHTNRLIVALLLHDPPLQPHTIPPTHVRGEEAPRGSAVRKPGSDDAGGCGRLQKPCFFGMSRLSPGIVPYRRAEDVKVACDFWEVVECGSRSRPRCSEAVRCRERSRVHSPALRVPFASSTGPVVGSLHAGCRPAEFLDWLAWTMAEMPHVPESAYAWRFAAARRTLLCGGRLMEWRCAAVPIQWHAKTLECCAVEPHEAILIFGWRLSRLSCTTTQATKNRRDSVIQKNVQAL